MPKKHVLAFHPDGEIEFTRNTHLSEVLAPLGYASMERVSDIRQKAYTNKFYIQWLLGKWAGSPHTRNLCRNYFNPDNIPDSAPHFAPEYMNPLDPMLFATYEDAVAHEIDMLNAMRLKGETFATEIQTSREHAAIARREAEAADPTLNPDTCICGD